MPNTVAIISSYNAGEYLKTAVDSLIGQTEKASRVVVIDDCSTDDSIASIRHYANDGIIDIISNSKNVGKAESLNNCFNKYEADYFVLLDSDDIAKPDRIEKQNAFMEANPEVACSSAFIEYINARGDVIGKGELDLLDDERLNQYLAGKEPFGLFCPAVIIRSEIVKKPELQFRKQFWPADDVDLWNRIAEAGFIVRAQPISLVQYRIHGNSAVTSGFYKTRMQFEWLRECLRARRDGIDEPTREEFMKRWESSGSITKINRWRKITAKGVYRSAGFRYAEKRFVNTCFLLLLAFILQPIYVSRRIMVQGNVRSK